jgi:hypothetical protein
MAKKRSKVSGKAKPESVTAPGPKSAAKISRGLRKQVRRLERQLVDAARTESKRIRKLERAHHRRQAAEAALEALRSIAPAKQATPAKAPAPVKSTAASKTAATRATAPKAPAATKAGASTPARPRAPRPAASSRRTAPKPPATAKPAATPPEPHKP